MKKKIIAGILLIGACVAHAQQGIGTNKPHSSAALDIKADNKGVLIPRVKLASTTDKTKIKKPINSLLVYNEGTTKVPEGYYYWLNNKWVKIIDAENLPSEDTSPAWQDANDKASKKPTDNIKRTGSVSIGNTTTTNSEKFAVKGATKLDGTLNVTGNTTLNGTLEVTGKTSLKTTPLLTSTNVSSLFVDKEGNVGTANIKKDSEIAFYKNAKQYVDDKATKFNAGTKINVPIDSSDEKLNSIQAEVNNKKIKINKSGKHLISGSITVRLNFIDDKSAYIAINLQLKRKNSNNWQTISGGRPIFPSIDKGVARYYPFTIPTVLEDLNVGDELQLIVYRTTAGGNQLQGSDLKEFGIGELHGSPAYTLSITKL